MKSSRISLRTVSSLALASMTALAATSSYALEVGRARLLSKPAQPLVLSVALRDWKPDDTLSIQIPNQEQWQQAGLTPPVALDAWQIELQPERSQILLRSSQVAEAKVIDVLLDIQSASGLQRHQVSVVNAAKVAEALQLPSAASATTESSYSAASQATTVSSAQQADSYTVRQGDTLGSLAQERSPAGVSSYQYMAALLAANPNAFQHGNMNLLKSGSLLNEPSAEQLVARSDAQARQLFSLQAQWFSQYKRYLAENKSPALAAAEATAGQVSQVEAAVSPVRSTAGDSLTLSTDTAEDSKQDREVATAQALQDASQNIEQLEDNVRQLSSALTDQEATAAQQGAADEAGHNSAAETAALNTAKNNTSSTDTGSTLSWIQEHLLIVMSALLALIVIIAVWVLRRANNSRAEVDSPAPVTPEMVREKLEKINLDLDVPPSDEPAPSERKPL